jgi:UDP:flavonoid glycosyltransferase YjiC (YdhE family)
MIVAFVVGQALGHVGRALSVARALREAQPCEIAFVGNNPGRYLQKYVSPYGFRIVALGTSRDPSPARYAEQLRSALSELNPAVIVFDLSPLPWLLLADPGSVPRVYLTNYFLTRIGSEITAQDEAFAANELQINAARRRAGLPVLGSARELYEADRVVLADPPDLLPKATAPPAHYALAGAIWWEPESELPSEFEHLHDILYVSLGSTGAALPAELLQKIARRLDVKHVVVVSTNEACATAAASVPMSYHTNLPGSRILARSSFAITQGGAGSCYQALGAGVPMAIWPNHRNHYVLGERLQQLGLALVLDAHAIETTLQGIRNSRAELADRLSRFPHMDSAAASRAAAGVIGELL